MRAVTAVAAAAFVVVLTVAAPAVSAQDGEGIYVTDVNLTPETPQVGETVTVEATVANGGDAPFDLSQVSAVRWETSETVTATDLGTIKPDGEIRVPLTMTFDSEGTKEFQIRASGTIGGKGVGNIRHPVTVEVVDSPVDVEASADSAAVGAWNPVEVEVSNGGGEEIRGLTATAEGYGVTTEEDGFLPRLEPGETETVDVLVSSDKADVKDVTVSSSYTNANGNSLTVEDTTPVRFEERDHELVLRASPSENGIEATVANLGNAAVQDVRVRGGDAASSVDVGDVDAHSSETVEMNVTGVERERTVELVASYELGGERETATTALDYTPRSNVRLTGTSVEGSGTVTVTGSASNVGVEDSQGVVVEVVDTPNVEPASPQSDYFVGTVPASDFGTFELNARVTGNVSEIPVRVSYVADGESYERVHNVSYGGTGSTEPPSQAGQQPETDEGSSGTPTWVFAVLAALVAGIVAYGWRRRG
ncbi:MAG: hypothetical protein ACOCRA_04510 [Halobacteria archaeon]